MATSTITANPVTVSISAKVKKFLGFFFLEIIDYVMLMAFFIIKENEWVAPQFHRKVHVNNRIYIEGAGIEKVAY